MDTYQDFENYPKLENKQDKLEGNFESRYFTPSIEDIRVGYECEQQFITTYDAGTKSERVVESWYPTVIQHIHNHQHPKIPNPVYRVPYLTKEQIEAEGWKDVTGPDDYLVFGSCHFDKGIYHLAFLSGTVIVGEEKRHTSTIVIRIDSHIRYAGECGDINTFRYICKLLGI